MKKAFKVDGLDCANCAAKIERSVAKLDGVREVKVSFMSQKMILDADDEKFDAILAEAAKIVKKTEPDATLVRPISS